MSFIACLLIINHRNVLNKNFASLLTDNAFSRCLTNFATQVAKKLPNQPFPKSVSLTNVIVNIASTQN